MYLEDDEDTVYNIEMQATKNRNLPKRSRYYQGMIDLNLIERGADYKELKSSYVIFICVNNPFDGRLHKYSFENISNENPEIKLNDGTTKVFLTPEGTQNDISEEMKAFLDFVAGNAPSSDLTKKLDDAVTNVHNHDEWKVEFMTLYMKYKEKYEEGEAAGLVQGRAEGEATGRIKTILELVDAGILSCEQAAERLGLMSDEFERLYGSSLKKIR